MSITVEKSSIMNKKLKILLIALAALAVIIAVAVVYLYSNGLSEIHNHSEAQKGRKKPSAFSGWMRGTRFVQTIGFLIKPVGARCARPSKPPPTANAPSVRHSERSEVLLRERKRADAKPVPRTGIYEGVFVTFQR